VPFKERSTERGKDVRILLLEKRVAKLEAALRALCDTAIGIDDVPSGDGTESHQSQYWIDSIKSARTVLGKTP
jgi:hypothetical protein